jgi:hypothetical protein
MAKRVRVVRKTTKKAPQELDLRTPSGKPLPY